MVTKPMKLELMYGSVGKRLMFRSICFSLILALMPLLYIVQDAGPCDLSAGAEPFYSPGGLGIESRAQTKIWAQKQKVKFYSGIYRDLMKQGLLKPGLKGLCVGGATAQAVLALKENGVPDALGIDRRSCKGKFRRLPFASNSFDFVFSGSLDRARAPALFALEIERTLKPSGVAIMVVSRKRVGKYSNPVHSLSPIVALFRNSDVVHVTVAGNCSVIALRKRSLPLKHCSPQKHNKNFMKLAEPLTENHSSAIYLPSVFDISAHNRHVYVEIGVNDTESSISGWFLVSYPKQSKSFKVYVFGLDESAPVFDADLSGSEAAPLKQSSSGQGLEIGGWMKRKINVEDFVVVKAGFQYVKGLIESGAMCLVDEIFVQCNHNNNGDCEHLLRSLRKNGVFAHKW